MHVFENAIDYGIEPNTSAYCILMNEHSPEDLSVVSSKICGVAFTDHPNFARFLIPPLFKLPVYALMDERTNTTYSIERFDPENPRLKVALGVNAAIVLPYRGIARPYHLQAPEEQRTKSYIYVPIMGLDPPLMVHMVRPVRMNIPYFTRAGLEAHIR